MKSPRGNCWPITGKKKDDGTWFPEQISLAKMNNVDIVWKSLSGPRYPRSEWYS